MNWLKMSSSSFHPRIHFFLSSFSPGWSHPLSSLSLPSWIATSTLVCCQSFPWTTLIFMGWNAKCSRVMPLLSHPQPTPYPFKTHWYLLIAHCIEIRILHCLARLPVAFPLLCIAAEFCRVLTLITWGAVTSVSFVSSNVACIFWPQGLSSPCFCCLKSPFPLCVCVWGEGVQFIFPQISSMFLVYSLPPQGATSAVLGLMDQVRPFVSSGKKENSSTFSLTSSWNLNLGNKL